MHDAEGIAACGMDGGVQGKARRVDRVLARADDVAGDIDAQTSSNARPNGLIRKWPGSSGTLAEMCV